MKIGVCSDLHLEFGRVELVPPEPIDVLILSGDICVARDGKGDRYRNFFETVSKQFPQIIYILGNHEYYHGDWEDTKERIKENFLTGLDNIHFLENEKITITEQNNSKFGDVLFIGTTLWTDLNKFDPQTILVLQYQMNDYHTILTKSGVLRPEVTGKQFVNSVDYIRKTYDEAVKENPDVKIVVCGHHAPSKQSTHPRYANDYHLNGGYSSDLESFVHDHPRILVWTHGHTHTPFDYSVGNTRIIANPRGYYGYEHNNIEHKLAVVEV